MIQMLLLQRPMSLPPWNADPEVIKKTSTPETLKPFNLKPELGPKSLNPELQEVLRELKKIREDLHQQSTLMAEQDGNGFRVPGR